MQDLGNRASPVMKRPSAGESVPPLSPGENGDDWTLYAPKKHPVSSAKR